MALVLTVALGAAFAGTSGSASAATGSDAAPPNAITRLAGTVPNVFFQDHTRPTAIASTNTVVMPDAANNVIIEFNAYSCPDLAVYDGDTYALKAIDRTRCPIGNADSGSSSKVPVAAIDSRDRLLFFAPVGGQVIAVSETNLATVVQFTPPSLLSGSLTGSIAGLSWDPRSDELVVSGVDPQSVSAYDIPAMLRATASGGVPTPLWNVSIASCGSQPTQPHFTTQAAYLAADDSAAFVLCELPESIPLGATNTNREGLVKVEMSPSAGAQACTPTAPFCPDGQVSTAAVPGVADDLLFDPQAERGFLPSQGQHGTDLLVYDGKLGSFAGRSSVGTPADQNSGIITLDPETGRLYALFASSGLTVIDGRRTPVSPGVVYQNLAGTVDYVSSGTLPPDASHPYTRLFVPFQTCAGGTCSVPSITVLADTLAVTQDPPQSSVDSGTSSGPIPPGSTVSSVYGSTARGYGFHVDYVGGPGGTINNITFGGSNGSQSSRPDVLGGVVQNLNLRTQGAIGDASALSDANGTTAGSVPASQPWPYNDSTCTSPGTPAQAQSSNAGAVSSGSGTSPQPVPGSDSTDAYSSVSCAGLVTADARYGAARGTGNGLPTVEIGSSETTSSVSAPTAANLISGTVTATAHGVSIDLGVAGSVSFGAVSQVVTAKAGGRPGTAGTVVTITLSNVSMTQNGQTTELCAGVCPGDPQGVINAINTAFPTLLEVSTPDVDGRYVHGSPGGYLAAVEANLPEQYGDQQFNGMSAEEATFHPALRIVMYGFNDGTPTLSREILDLAGAEVDSELGINVLPPPTSTDVATLTEQQVQQAAGLITTSVGVGTPGTPGTPGHPGTSVGTATLGSFAQQVFNGLQSLLRTPLGALKMLGFLGLLGLPIVMMRRRWTWMTEAEASAS